MKRQSVKNAVMHPVCQGLHYKIKTAANPFFLSYISYLQDIHLYIFYKSTLVPVYILLSIF